MLTNTLISFRDASAQVSIDLPNSCPHCGNIMTPNIYKGVSEYNRNDTGNIIGVLAQCNASSCKKFFSLSYKYVKKTEYSSEYNLIEYSYSPPVIVSLPDNIDKVSPDFAIIYNEASIAESENLLQIAGVGYRKAAEFLIKDYAIRNNMDKEAQIKTMLLGQVIKKYLNDFPKIQTLAIAISWIGNDETHYVRRHNDKDIKDLKRFILSSAQFIAADYDVDEALEFTSSDEK